MHSRLETAIKSNRTKYNCLRYENTPVLIIMSAHVMRQAYFASAAEAELSASSKARHS